MATGEKVVAPEWLTSLYNNSVKSDIEILVNADNGISARFAAHSFVLIHQSVVFEKMLEPGRFLEGVTGRITITDVKPFVFQYILRFLYTSELPEYINFGEYMDLMKAAHFYQLNGLLLKCISRLRDFSVTELCKVYELCMLLDFPETLKSKCLGKMTKNGALIMRNDLHLELNEASLQNFLSSKFWCDNNGSSSVPTSGFTFQPYNVSNFGSAGFAFNPGHVPQPLPVCYPGQSFGCKSIELASGPCGKISEKEVVEAVIRWAKWRCIVTGKELKEDNVCDILEPLRANFQVDLLP